MRVTRRESLEPRTPQSRAQPINQSRDFHFTDTAALQIQLRWGKRFGSRHAQSHQIEAKARIERIIETVEPFPKQSYHRLRSEEHTSELQSLMRISFAVFCLKKKNRKLSH